MARLRRLGLIATLLGAGVTLSACGSSSAVADARTSCHHVHEALGFQSRSDAKGISTSARDALRARALSELLKGGPAAAAATSADGSWNALQTTIAEAERVPLANLVPALRRLCQVADSSTPYL